MAKRQMATKLLNFGSSRVVVLFTAARNFASSRFAHQFIGLNSFIRQTIRTIKTNLFTVLLAFQDHIACTSHRMSISIQRKCPILTLALSIIFCLAAMLPFAVVYVPIVISCANWRAIIRCAAYTHRTSWTACNIFIAMCQLAAHETPMCGIRSRSVAPPLTGNLLRLATHKSQFYFAFHLFTWPSCLRCFATFSFIIICYWEFRLLHTIIYVYGRRVYRISLLFSLHK